MAEKSGQHLELTHTNTHTKQECLKITVSLAAEGGGGAPRDGKNNVNESRSAGRSGGHDRLRRSLERKRYTERRQETRNGFFSCRTLLRFPVAMPPPPTPQPPAQILFFSPLLSPGAVTESVPDKYSDAVGGRGGGVEQLQEAAAYASVAN